MRVLVTGAGGQVGRELVDTCPDDVELTACTREQLDICRPDQVEGVLEATAPDLVINTAAFTAVDRAEEEEALALAVNAEGAANIARAAQRLGARLLHLSTDFVFSGDATGPYPPTAEPHPQGVYGASKLAGERRVSEIASANAVVVRTAWVYSRFGHNFVKTMLRLMASRPEISVVSDQIGSPTWARGLATMLWACRHRSDLPGLLHWTDLGVGSWYDLAVAVQEEATTLGLLTERSRVSPVTTAEYPTAARRPPFSVLDSRETRDLLDLPGAHWRRQLRAMLGELREKGED